MKTDRSLFAPDPRRKRSLILTLMGSLLFHGSLVGIAALWSAHPTPEPPKLPLVDITDGLPGDPQLPEPPPPTGPEPEAPTLNVVEPTADQLPIVEPDADDMTVAAPTPRPALTRSTTPHSREASAAARVPVSSSASGHGPVSMAAGSGSGTGRSGVRWIVPKPVYPPALRLAHVQGSGSVRVTTDGAGRVVSTVIVQSTGSMVLDDQTCQTAKTRWSGPANATTTVPITYRLQ